jgi:hypothetical protein
MRPVLLSLTAALLVFACSKSDQASPDAEASEASPGDDGSTMDCTDIGGTCVPYTTSCPLPQQNAALCGNTVMLCCLSTAPAAPPTSPDGGVQPAPGDDAAPPPADASSAPNG